MSDLDISAVARRADDRTIVDFDEEKTRRITVEANRLAGLAPGEWRIWIDRGAESLGITRATLEPLVTDIIRTRERTARDKAAEDRRIEQRAEKKRTATEREQKREYEREQRQIEKDAARKSKEKQKAFAKIQKLAPPEREARLIELAKLLDEDLETVRAEFIDLIGDETHTDPGYVEPWEEPVDTKALLPELMQQLRRYVVIHDDGVITVTLWVMMAWLHAEIATHSPILVMTSAEADSGKTTSLSVLGFLTPRPYTAVEMTGPGVFHIVDQITPTLIVDEADKLFQRKTDLMHIINAGWTHSAKIPRLVRGVVRQFDVFCPKIIGMKGFDLPTTTASRAIVIKMLPKLPEDKVEDFKFVDDDTFLTLRRKLARWSLDNAAVLKDASPTMPKGFGNRLAQNWRLLLAIADLVGGDFAKNARKAAIKLTRRAVKRSEGVRLLEALRGMVAACEEITSADIMQRLRADADAEWCEFRGHGPITQRQIAALLAEYDIQPVTIHPTKRAGLTRRGYRRAQFDDAFQRFLPPIRTSKHSTDK